jgi:signal transduction histidine kinase
MQIRIRLTLQFIVVVSLIVLFSFTLIYYSAFSYNNKEFYERLENKAKTTAELFISVAEIDSTTLRIFDKKQRDKLPFENINIYNDQNKLVYSTTDSTIIKADQKMFSEINYSGTKRYTQGNVGFIGIKYHAKRNTFIILAGAMDMYGRAKLNNLRNTLVVLYFVIVTILALAGWIYSGRALKPLTSVIGEVKNMKVDRLDTRLRRSQHRDEIGQLIETFNTLLNRIEDAFNLQKLFVSGASHELKNPLASITSQLQVVLLNERSNEEYKTIIASILNDIKSLNKTTLDLMEYARLNYEGETQLFGVRIDDILWYCRDFIIKSNPDYKVIMNFGNLPEDEKKLIIKGNDALLKIAFINLIDNACKFSDDKTCLIELNLNASGRIMIRFNNKGEEMTREQIGFIFEPFYRANPASKVKGTGIGLALTKKIVQLHEASIAVESGKKKGTTFSVYFNPVA